MPSVADVTCPVRMPPPLAAVPLAAVPRRRQHRRMLHLMKLAVGVRDPAHLAALQAARARTAPPLRHVTRNRPRRAAEVLDGGSLYWVIGGMLAVRQAIRDIIEEAAADGIARTALVLDPALVALAGRPMQPFQGWRYLRPEAAPPDLAAAAAATGVEALPAALRADLRALGLL